MCSSPARALAAKNQEVIAPSSSTRPVELRVVGYFDSDPQTEVSCRRIRGGSRKYSRGGWVGLHSKVAPVCKPKRGRGNANPHCHECRDLFNSHSRVCNYPLPNSFMQFCYKIYGIQNKHLFTCFSTF